LRALPHLARSVAGLLPSGANTPEFRAFLDAQLLISAQTTAAHANALYGSAALDLPRRGVNHVQGGIGGLAQTLVNWLRAHGGEIRFRQTVERIEVRGGRAVAVQTDKGLRLECRALIANLTPWALRALLGEAAPPALRRETERRPAAWGAFTLYLGLDALGLPAGAPDHHQIILDPAQPLGEGNSVFISLSDPADPSRAPRGMRAATLSTHTAIAGWEAARRAAPDAYADRVEAYTARLLQAAERALPGLRGAARLCLPGTPLTFARFTRRPQGMVGGFPQTSLFAARGPRTGLSNAWLVGDSIFPGQSTAGVTLGALRVAAGALRRLPRAFAARASQPPGRQPIEQDAA
jgi:phytoene dehydrogenase-like protein